MGSTSTAGYLWCPDRVRDEVDELRVRYRALSNSRVTPMQKAEVARIGAKLAELLHLGCASHGVREEAAISLLTSWIASRIDAFEAQGRARTLYIQHG
jgi:hypothetical protein